MVKDTTGKLRAALYGRSSVFIGTMETPIERIMYHIIYDALLSGEDVVWVCLKETPGSILSKFSSYELPLTGLEERLWFVDATLIGDKTAIQHTFRCASMDYTCLTMHVAGILNKHPRSLVMLDSLGILAILGRVDIVVRFMKVLDTRIRSAGGGLMTILAYQAMPDSVEAKLIGFMDTVIHVEDERIHAHVGSKELSIPFSFNGSELTLGSEDTEKDLRELFRLTSEERKNLELEVEEKAHLYRELIE